MELNLSDIHEIMEKTLTQRLNLEIVDFCDAHRSVRAHRRNFIRYFLSSGLSIRIIPLTEKIMISFWNENRSNSSRKGHFQEASSFLEELLFSPETRMRKVTNLRG